MNDSQNHRLTGSCLCGSVRFGICGPFRDVSYCHCVMCQRVLSHFAAYTACEVDKLEVTDPRRKLKWYRSSPKARRAFCGTCGSQLFWESDGGGHVSVSAGSLDQPTGLHPGRHIFLEHVADYDREAQGQD